MNLESLYHETNRQLNEVQSRIGDLDRMTLGPLASNGSDENIDKTDPVRKEILARIEQILR